MYEDAMMKSIILYVDLNFDNKESLSSIFKFKVDICGWEIVEL